MAVTFILGRAGSGKTRYCLDALTAELAGGGEGGRLLFITPEQASFQMERELALRDPRGGYSRAEVLSFSRLAHTVFGESGREPRALRGSARAMALRCAAGEHPEDFRAFGSAAETPGFFKQLDRFLEELFVEDISPEEFRAAAGRTGDEGLRRRAEAAALIYERYLEWLGPERIDPALRLKALRERLGEWEALREAKIWVDGFAGFTGQEAATLVMLAGAARETAITLLLDPDAADCKEQKQQNELRLFNRTETTYQLLKKRLIEEGVEVRRPVLLRPEVTPRFVGASLLEALERGLATYKDEKGKRTGAARPRVALEGEESAVHVVECETHEDEIRAAARFIRESVRESGGALRYRDFALIARDLGPFADAAADVFSEYEIPYFIDRRRSLGTHVLSRLVEGIFETLGSDFSANATTRLLRSGMAPLAQEHAELLENVVRVNEVRGQDLWGRGRWRYEWSPRVSDEEAAALDAGRARIVQALAPLAELARRESGATGKEWAPALHQAIVDLGASERLAAWIKGARLAGDLETAETHRLAWEAWLAVLEDLHDVLGERPLTLGEAASVAVDTLGEATVGLAPPMLDQTLISSIERSRHPDIKYAWLMAFNEGIFPARPGDDVFLPAGERAALVQAGLRAPRPRKEDAYAERMLAYIAMTRPSVGLRISYARTGLDGSPRGASSLLEDAYRAAPGMTRGEHSRDEAPACLADFARGRLAARAGRYVEPRRHQRYEALYAELKRDAETGARLKPMFRGLGYRNTTETTPGYARGDEAAWSGSHSELDQYIRCPFRHFASYGLRLREATRATSVSRELGQRAHEILAGAIDRGIKAAKSTREISDAEWLGYLDEAVREADGGRSEDYARRRPQLAFLAGVQRRFVVDVLLAQAGRWRLGEFEPWICEQRYEIGGEGALQALELRTERGEAVRLKGFIDRIDRCEREGRLHLLVYDYKSGGGGLAGSYLTQARLQTAIYMLAIGQAYGEKACAGAFLAPLTPSTKTAMLKEAASWTADMARMQAYRPRGMFVEEAARLLDRELGQLRSPAAAMQLKKDGTFDSNKSRDVVTGEDLAGRMRLGEATVLQAAEGIIDGVIQISPLIEKRTLACRDCEYARLCRFEPAFNKPRLAEAALPTAVENGGESEGGEG